MASTNGYPIYQAPTQQQQQQQQPQPQPQRLPSQLPFPQFQPQPHQQPAPPAAVNDPVKTMLDGIGAAIGASLMAQHAIDVQAMLVNMMGKTYEDCRRQLVQPVQIGSCRIAMELPTSLTAFVPAKGLASAAASAMAASTPVVLTTTTTTTTTAATGQI
jgi:hypothetical protein